MKSDAYYRHLLVVDVLDEMSPMTSPALHTARWAVDELGDAGIASPDYWRDLLLEVLGDLAPGPESMPIERAQEAMAVELAEQQRPASDEREAELTAEARRVLAHIQARTDVDKFATVLRDMPQASWRAALDELARAGHRIEWTLGTVADDPIVTGGYVLREPAKRETSHNEDKGLEL